MKKNQFFDIVRSILFLTLLLGVLNWSYAQNDRISITGYGEINFSSTFGEPSDEEAANLYEEFGLFKEYSEPRNDVRFPGVGLVFTSNIMDEKLSFLTELNFRTRFNKIELGIERCYLTYTVNNSLNIQTGIYASPIGSMNMVERNHGFLSNSIHPRDMVNLELGLIPTHVFGLKMYGSFESSSQMAINYVLSAGSGRGLTPTQSPFEIDLFEDQETSLSLSGGLETVIPVKDASFTLGLSGYIIPKFSSLYLDSLGMEVDVKDLDEFLAGDQADDGTEPALESMQMKEYGFAPYVRFNSSKLEYVGEIHTSVMKGLDGSVEDRKFSYTGFSTELAYKTELSNKKFVPYVRYDYTKLPENGGYYYGLHIQNDELKRYLISNNNVLMIGASWNIFPFNKIKVEYDIYFDGPQPKHGVFLQSAFIF